MKRIVLLIITLFSSFFLTDSVLADVDRRVGKVTCNYEKGNEKVSITYYNSAAASGDAEVYYKVEKQEGDKVYCYSSSIATQCDLKAEVWKTMGIYNFDGSFQYDNQNFYSIRNRLMRYSYTETSNLNPEEICSEAIFVTDFLNDEMDDIVLCETTDTFHNEGAPTECNYNSSSLLSLESNTVGINSYAGSNDTDYTQYYNDTRLLKEKYCNEENKKDYNAELCAKYSANVDATVTAAEESGTSKEELEKSYGDFIAKINLEFKEASCDALLGDKIDHTAPAYYLDLAFSIIKYAAVIMFFVFTIIEYAKAVASSNQDAVKKATQTTIKRLIIAAVIFFLPILIDFVLTVLGVVSENGTCGIGFN